MPPRYSVDADAVPDGRWILATCRTFLMLIDALQKDAGDEGKPGFRASFDEDGTPQSCRLGFLPDQIAHS